MKSLWWHIPVLFGALLLSVAFGAHADAIKPDAEFRFVPAAAAIVGDLQGAKGTNKVFLLVDYSWSMTDTYDGKDPAGKGKKRWDFLKQSIKDQLVSLSKTSTNIEVTVRFFTGTTKPGASGVPSTLSVPDITSASIAQLMQQFPGYPGLLNATALYQAISESCDALISQSSTGADGVRPSVIDWLLFVVVSDGVDTRSGSEFQQGGGLKAWDAQLMLLRNRIPNCQACLLPVGKEAELEQANGTTYRGLANIASTFPQPPAPRPQFRLTATNPTAVPLDLSLRAGDVHELTVVIDGDWSSLKPDIAVSLASDSLQYFELIGKPTFANGKAQVKVKVKSGDWSKGGDLTVRVSASTSAVTGPIAVGASSKTYRFRPDVVPSDPASWKVDGPEVIRIGTQPSFSVFIRDAKEIKWVFHGPRSADVPAVGQSVAPNLSSAGQWNIDLKATSETGVVRQRQGIRQVAVIDASCKVDGPTEFPVASKLTFSVTPLGPSDATYRWLVNGEEVGVGTRLEDWRADSVGSFRLMCEATSTQGKFLFSSEPLVLKSTIAPLVVLREPVSLVEGMTSFPVVFAAYDVAKIHWKYGASQDEVALRPEYPPDGLRYAMVRAELDPKRIRDLASTGVVKISWWGEDSNGKPATPVESRELPIERADIVLRLVEPSAAGSPIERGKAARFRIGAAFVARSGQSSDPGFDSFQSALLNSCTIDFEVVDGNAAKVKGAEQPNQPLIDRVASISLTPSLQEVGPIRLRANIQSDRLIFDRPMQDLGSFPLVLPAANYQWSVPPASIKAFGPVQLGITGLSEGDRVSWSVARIGCPSIQWVDSKATTTAPATFPEGNITVSATVTRVDGTTQVALPAQDMTVESTLKLGLGGAWLWDGGTAPLPHAVKIEGSQAEIDAIESVTWVGANADGSDKYSALVTASVTNCSLPAMTRLAATVRYRSGCDAKDKSLSGTLEIGTVVPEANGNLSLIVGGNTSSGRGGGLLVVSQPPIKGTYCGGTDEVVVVYTPDDLARARSQASAEFKCAPGASITVSDVQTGTWEARLRVVRPGSASPVDIASASFTNLRTLNLLAFAIWVSVAILISALVLWIGGIRNEAIWQAVVLAFDKDDLSSRGKGVRPKVRGLRSGRAPLFNVFTKSAECGLGEFNLLPQGAADSPRSSWLFDEQSGKCRATLEWRAGKRPQLQDRGRPDWQYEELEGGIRQYEPARKRRVNTSSTAEDLAEAAVERPSPLYMYVRKDMSSSKAIPYVCRVFSVAFTAGAICYAAIWVL